MDKKELKQTIQTLLEIKKDCYQIIDGSKPIRINGALFSLYFKDEKLWICPYGGGFLKQISEELLMSDDVEIVDHPSILGKQRAYFEVGDYLIAQGWFNPEYRWNGWDCPVFSIEECNKLIEIFHAESDEESGHRFRRNDEDTGFYYKDLYSDPDQEYFVEDSILTLDNGQVIKVNSLIDGWCWVNINPERYEELNKAIAEGSYKSTVSKLD